MGESRWSSHSPARGSGDRGVMGKWRALVVIVSWPCLPSWAACSLRMGNLPLGLGFPWTFWVELKSSHRTVRATSECVTSGLTSQRACGPVCSLEPFPTEKDLLGSFCTPTPYPGTSSPTRRLLGSKVLRSYPECVLVCSNKASECKLQGHRAYTLK